MIQRKIFYSVIQVDGIVCSKKHDGYELQIDGEKFNAYQSLREGSVYILDPKNGLALQIYDVGENEDELSEIELIERAKDKLIQSGFLSKWKEKRGNESYRLSIEMFKAYKRAELLREKLRETERREIEERRQQDNE